MKPILQLTFIFSLFFLSNSMAENFRLEEGSYLLITNESGGIQIIECKITNTKDGDFIKLVYEAPSPDLERTPSKICYLKSHQFQFSIGPDNYPNPAASEKIAAGISLYVGSQNKSEISGTYTSVQVATEPTSCTFTLYKK